MPPEPAPLRRWSLSALLWALSTCLTVHAAPVTHTTLSAQLHSLQAPADTFPAVQMRWEHQRSLDPIRLNAELRGQAGDTPHFSSWDIQTLSASGGYTFQGGRSALHVEAGLGRVYWGVTEARQLVDIINQRDDRVDPGGRARLSQPMLQASLQRPGQSLGLWLLPCHRPRPTAPVAGDRARQPGTDASAFTPLRCERLDSAVRASLVRGPADIGLSVFNGHSRTPFAGRAETEVPHAYPVITRSSLDAQWTLGRWLLKTEGMIQHTTAARHSRQDQAIVGGFEYELANAMGGASDLYLLYEFLDDTRCDTLPAGCGHMAGIRWQANDIAGTSMLLSILRTDDAPGHPAPRLEVRRRLHHQWQLAVDGGGLPDHRYASLTLHYGF